MSTGRLAFPSNLAYHLERTPKFLGGRQLAAMMVRPLLARQSQSILRIPLFLQIEAAWQQDKCDGAAQKSLKK